MAKTDRAIELLESLHAEMREFAAEPQPYRYINTVDPANGHYIFRLHPNWEPNTARRWAVVIGEIVHDLRSALDHLAWEVVRLSGGEPDSDHAFPIWTTEPDGGFAHVATREGSGSRRHGKLCGASPAVVTLIESYQPFKGGATGNLLVEVDELWRCDKHRMPLPIVLVGRQPTLELRDCELLERHERLVDGIHVVEIAVTPIGPSPQVDLEADAPFDIAFGGRPVINDLLNAAQVLLEIRYKAEELFPDAEDIELRKSRKTLERMLSARAD